MPPRYDGSSGATKVDAQRWRPPRTPSPAPAYHTAIERARLGEEWHFGASKAVATREAKWGTSGHLGGPLGVAPPGFEPGPRAPKALVLPLHQGAAPESAQRVWVAQGSAAGAVELQLGGLRPRGQAAEGHGTPAPMGQRRHRRKRDARVVICPIKREGRRATAGQERHQRTGAAQR